MGDLREPNGAVLGDSSVPSSSSSSLSSLGQDPFLNSPELWARAEQATQEIIRQVQPTVVSEERRRDVIDYVQRLLKSCIGCVVFPFGSVPLKTYLPDGDIDLTAFGGFETEDKFASKVYAVLEAEDHNPAAEFVVKDVQIINAEVRLVKCLVQNLVVDISFNQIGGLCALCFLEEIDHLIGKDHLFKRSIILIKAWCYYESRILGAHHGLISTYALETLVLYIFHLFHSSLNGPLAVLHKFLDYFSKFDWDNFCVSLSGPIHMSSFPEIVAERPENGGGDLLLTDDFMRECVKRFSVPSRVTETHYKMFALKHLNIVDPLKENNNLGRSVSRGNFFRIRSAFSFGARKLGQILLQPQENIAGEVRRFFTNTLDRHGQGQRPDVHDHLHFSACNGFLSETFEQNYYHEEDFREPGTYFEGPETQQQRGVNKSFPSRIFSSSELSKDDRLCGDAIDLATNGTRELSITNHVDKLSPSIEEDRKSPLGEIRHAPHLYFSRPFVNGKLENGDLVEERPNSRSVGTSGNHETLNLLPELSGDVESHLENLRYGRWWFDHLLTTPISPIQLAQVPVFQTNHPWDAIRQSVHFRQDMVPPHVNVNGVVPRPPFFPINPPMVAGEIPKARGTGTYFPITNHQSYRDRFTPAKGRSQGPLKSPRANGRAQTHQSTSPQAQSPVHQGGYVKPRSLDSHENSLRAKVFKEPNGFIHASENAVEFIPPGHSPLEPPEPESESSRAIDTVSSPGSQYGEPVFVVNHDYRLSVQSYRLKDDEDFPPLSI